MEFCSIDGCQRPKRCNTPIPCCKMHRKRWDRKKNFESSWYKPYKNKNGYLRITLKKGEKRVLHHRLIMEEFLGRKLTANEQVHHLNKDKTDNRIENLIVTDQHEHNHKYHNQNWKHRKVNNPYYHK